MATKKTHGGARPGSGKKPLDPDSPTIAFPVKMSANQRDKLKRLGGALFVRRKIDEEPEPSKE